MSLSARRAWIEIMDDLEPSKTRRVALRKESVDRNIGPLIFSVQPRVALRKESVDRNKKKSVAHETFNASLSARRAWIEIVCGTVPADPVLSLSARRAWIEIWAWGPRGTGAGCRSPQGERG